MGIGSTGYKIVFLLHILCAIIGFGAVMLNGIYAAEVKKRRGAEGLAILQANTRVSQIGEIFIMAVPLFGIGLVFMSDGAWRFSQTWVWSALGLFVVALGISLGFMAPAVKRQEGLMKELLAGGPPPAGASEGPPPQVAQLEANGKKMAMAGGLLHLALVTMLFLMIFKPGV
ncbi:MAG TPA: hypothetical protein VMY88_10020 [Acidimicrobiales bacterium]|nr:hypothetical protein [Acidimicrobiales bacterium]